MAGVRRRPPRPPFSSRGLANGPHHVDVVGKRDSGWDQDAAELGPDAVVTRSRTWVVDTNYIPPSKPTVRLNEILAENSATLTNAGSTPDLIELYNYGSAPVDLSGMGISDNASSPYNLAEFDVDGYRVEGRSGVWVRRPLSEDKVAAIGVRVQRGVTMHGFALNCDNSLAAFRSIVPCGITDAGVTTISEIIGADVTPADVLATVEDAFLAEYAGVAA